MDDASRRALFDAWFSGPPMNGDREALIRKSGYTKGRISQLFDPSQQFGERAARSLAQRLGLPAEFFNTPGGGPLAEAVELDGNADFPAVRRVQFKLSAGASGFAIEYLEDDDAPIVFRREWFESRGYNPAKLFAVRVANGSMQPGLWHGDTVVVNTADTEPKDGEAFAVNFEGELVIKRLVRDEGRWWLKSDNPDQSRYPRKACDERVFILGRIVHKQSEHV